MIPLIILGFALIILLLIPKPIEERFQNKDSSKYLKNNNAEYKQEFDPPFYSNKNLPNLIQEPLKGNPNLTWNENAITTKWISDLRGYLPSV
jgi:hypothetical protein